MAAVGSYTPVLGTGIQQISQRFDSLFGLLLYSLITDFLWLSISLTQARHPKKQSYASISQSMVQCSKEIVFHLSGYVMLLNTC